MWPKGNAYLQFLIACCFFLLFLGRIVNLFVPIQYKIVIDALTPGSSTEAENKTPYFAWGAILVFVFLRFLQGGVGLLNSLQSFLWIRVGQYTTREISVKVRFRFCSPLIISSFSLSWIFSSYSLFLLFVFFTFFSPSSCRCLHIYMHFH